nr:NAD/NADP octopine/nopaline dehydrogenase family protein [Pseudonocardia sp. HH130630-07]
MATPRISELIGAIDAERLALADAQGVPAVSFPDFLTRSYGVTEGTLSERIQSSYGPLDFPEPDSPSHRYFTEDIPFSMVIWSSLAARIGCPMPLTDAVIDISAVLCGRDWQACARTAGSLGLGGADAAGIVAAFTTKRHHQPSMRQRPSSPGPAATSRGVRPVPMGGGTPTPGVAADQWRGVRLVRRVQRFREPR